MEDSVLCPMCGSLRVKGRKRCLGKVREEILYQQEMPGCISGLSCHTWWEWNGENDSLGAWKQYSTTLIVLCYHFHVLLMFIVSWYRFIHI